MPRLNGRFVSQAVYDEAAANNPYHTEETPVTDVVENTEEPATDKRFGLRPETVYKRALSAEVSAQVKYQKAKRRVDAFEAKGQALRDALDAAEVVLTDATDAAEAARVAFNDEG